MGNDQLEVGDLLQRTWAAISAAPAAVIGFIVAVSAFGSFVDFYWQESPGGFFLVTVVSFVAGYFLLRALLRGCGLLREGEGGGFGAYFGASFLGGLGILLGFVFLIVPGLILMVRWSAAFALVLSEDESAGDALGASWEITRGNFWPIFAALLVGLVPLVVFVVLVGAGLGFSGWTADATVEAVLAGVAANFIGTLYSAFSTAVGVAVYWMLRAERRGISEVFV